MPRGGCGQKRIRVKRRRSERRVRDLGLRRRRPRFGFQRFSDDGCERRFVFHVRNGRNGRRRVPRARRGRRRSRRSQAGRSGGADCANKRRRRRRSSRYSSRYVHPGRRSRRAFARAGVSPRRFVSRRGRSRGPPRLCRVIRGFRIRGFGGTVHAKFPRDGIGIRGIDVAPGQIGRRRGARAGAHVHARRRFVFQRRNRRRNGAPRVHRRTDGAPGRVGFGARRDFTRGDVSSRVVAGVDARQLRLASTRAAVGAGGARHPERDGDVGILGDVDS